jgi:hypothetical protein
MTGLDAQSGAAASFDARRKMELNLYCAHRNSDEYECFVKIFEYGRSYAACGGVNK